MQLRHAVLPASGANLPAWHWRQVGWRGLGLNEPGRQVLGVLEPTEQDVPAGQMTQSVVRLLRKPMLAIVSGFAYVPPGHGCGAVAPSAHM